MRARENPFRTECLESLEFRFPVGESWEQLLARLEANRWCGAIVGSHGSGKTTLMEQLAPRLEERGFSPRFFHLRAESSQREKDALVAAVRPLRAPDIILLDGAEQLSTRQWLPLRAAAAHAAGFIVTLHRSSRLPVVYNCETSESLLEELVEALTGGRLPGPEYAALMRRHMGNMRECLRELYDRWAGV